MRYSLLRWLGRTVMAALAAGNGAINARRPPVDRLAGVQHHTEEPADVDHAA